jgi:hypothetical protein
VEKVRVMTIAELIHDFEVVAADDSCDGSCDELPPYKKCPRCHAREVLNTIGSILREEYNELCSQPDRVPSP